MKPIIYQLLPRLFSNTCQSCTPNGDILQNGCGKMNDITLQVIREIKKLGVTHIWYTGLLEHATQTDYSAYHIPSDHPAMVKGKAGSPYAVKDYYDIDPDLASHPDLRFQEFLDLLQRTHQEGVKVIMDFIPNHVARQYRSDCTPKGISQLGENDSPDATFSPDNNFYYLSQPLRCQFDMQGEASSPYQENPAKATGNDCFSPSPTRNDWYETVKLNYGVDYTDGGRQYFDPIPDTWHKMLHILLFWASQGIDGFRCDMAEMVPVAFWQWAVNKVKYAYPNIIFIGEVYNPSLYRTFVHACRFDWLYDKVGLYDTLRGVTCGYQPALDITRCWQNLEDISDHMLNFLENHDEQRLASDFFIGDGRKGKAAVLVSSCLGRQPFMLYHGQEFGERGMDAEGFSGRDGRTTIFDYWSVPALRRWMQGNNFDGSLLTEEESDIYEFYKKIMNIAVNEPAISDGDFFDLMYANTCQQTFDSQHTFAFLRSHDHAQILVVANFSDHDVEQKVIIPQHAFHCRQIPQGRQLCTDLLTGGQLSLDIWPDRKIPLFLPAYSGVLLKWE